MAHVLRIALSLALLVTGVALAESASAGGIDSSDNSDNRWSDNIVGSGDE